MPSSRRSSVEASRTWTRRPTSASTASTPPGRLSPSSVSSSSTAAPSSSAVRVPTANVSLVDLCVVPEKVVTKEEINAAMTAAAEGSLKGVLGYESDPLVSMDFNHDPHSSTFAPAQTNVTKDGLIRVVSWYDNEWGFANRMLDTGRKLAQLSKA